MKVRVYCPNPDCGRRYKVDQTQLGRQTVCRVCGQQFTLKVAVETLRPDAQSDTAVGPAGVLGGEIPAKLGRFEVRGRLGAGAFATVYRAYDPVLDREVAVKVPRAVTLEKPEVRARFLREPKAAAQLRHPNIVPVYDAGSDGGQYYIASAYIEGRTLEDVIDDDPPGFRRAAEIVRDLAGALDYAHRMGVVHRDVKPANIMIDGRGEALLTDFGLARLESTEEKLTQDGSVMGTPAYMAPEQADGSIGEVGPASDQYSLGAVLYELLCGRPPFSGPPAVLIFSALHQEPGRPRSVNPRVPRDLETICLKAMSKRPGERYGDCLALAEDLHRWLNDEPIRARRLGTVERTVRWARRNPIVATLVVAVALITIVGLAAVTWQWRRAEVNLTEAQRQQRLAEQNLAEANRQREAAEKNLAEAVRQRALAELAEQKASESLAEATRQKERAEEAREAEQLQRTRAQLASGDAEAARLSAEKNLHEAQKQREMAQQREQTARRQLYAIRMNSAMQALSTRNLERLKYLLESQVPEPGGEDLRSFEWYYLASRITRDGRPTSQAGSVTLGHSYAVHEVRFSADSRTLMSIGRDMTVKFWDVASATLKGSLGPPGELEDAGNGPDIPDSNLPVAESLVLSPDGETLAVALLGYWSVQLQHCPEGTSLTLPAGCFGPVAFAPEGRSLALVAVGAVGEPGRTPEDPGTIRYQSTVELVALNLLATLGRSAGPKLDMTPVDVTWEVARRFDLVSPAPLIQGPPTWVRSIHFSPTGRILAVAHAQPLTQATRGFPPGERYTTVSVWEIASGRKRFSLDVALTAHDQIVFSPDGAKLALMRFTPEDARRVSPQDAPTVYVYETEYGQPLAQFEGSRGTNRMGFSPDGKTLTMWRALPRSASPKEERDVDLLKEIGLWDAETGELRVVLAGHKYVVRCAAFSPDGKTVATASEDKTIRLWDPGTGLERMTITDHTSGVRSLAFSPDGMVIASGSSSGTVRLHKAERVSWAGGQQPAILKDRPFLILSQLGLHVEDDSLGEGQNTRTIVRLLDVVEDTPARRAGFQVGDVILSVDGRPVESSDGLLALIQQSDDGSDLRILVQREGKQRTLLLIPGPSP